MGLFKGAKFTSRSQKIDAFQSTVCEFGTPGAAVVRHVQGVAEPDVLSGF